MIMMAMRQVSNDNVKTPCLNCANRSVGCHGGCNNYKSYRERLDKANETIRDSKNKSDVFLNYIK